MIFLLIALPFKIRTSCRTTTNEYGLKRIRHILNTLTWVVVGLYLTVSALLHIPFIQQYTGKCVASALKGKLGTEVSVGCVNLGFLNRLIIDDFEMLDKRGEEMIHVSRLSVSVDVVGLLGGQIRVSSAQVLGLKANLYKTSANAQPNFQFALDSLKSKDGSPSKTDLHIGSFIVRHGSVKYDRLDAPSKRSGFDSNHLFVDNINADVRLKRLTDNELSVGVKKFSFDESCGLSLKNIAFHLEADRKHAALRDFKLMANNSAISSDSITASYSFTPGGNIIPESILAKGNVGSDGVSLADLAVIVPEMQDFPVVMKMSASFVLTNGKLTVRPINLYSQDRSIKINAWGEMKPFSQSLDWKANINDIYVSEKGITDIMKAAAKMKVVLPSQITKLKTLRAKAAAAGNGCKMAARAEATTNLGGVKAEAKKNGDTFTMAVSASNLEIGVFTGDKSFGRLSFNAKGKGTLNKGSLESVSAEGDIPLLEYNNYAYNNVKFDMVYGNGSTNGKIYVADPNLNAEISGTAADFDKILKTEFTATVNCLYPQRLKLSNKWGDAYFKAHIQGRTVGTAAKNLTADVTARDFLFKSPTNSYSLDNMHATVSPGKIGVNADFGSIELQGKYNMATLGESVFGILKNKLPTLPGLSKKQYAADNTFSIKADITETKWLETLAGIPLHVEKPVRLAANIDDRTRSISARADLPEFSYDGNIFRNGEIKIDTRNDSIFANAMVEKVIDDNNDIKLRVKAHAAHNDLKSTVSFDYNTPTRIKGELKTNARFFADNRGKNSVLLNIEPSQLVVKDSVWAVRPSSVAYYGDKIEFNHFAVEKGRQHIKINGLATKSLSDSICVDLQDVDVSYILNLIDFHSVEFSGQATGQAFLKSVLNSPEAYANIRVNDFKFQDGDMGVLHANVNWNKVDKQIDISAVARESETAKTVIKGYVSPERNYIDLGIKAENTNIAFLKSFCGSFMSDINATGNGFAQVYGDLSTVNLRGLVVANGDLKISTLNTRYYLHNDTVRMEPNEIIFNHAPVKDRNGSTAYVSGALHHKNLSNLTFDINVEANNFLCYDFTSYGDDPFYGTVYGTGNCAITGRANSIMFDINMTPQKGSFIEYNAANPDAITSQDFISWVKRGEGKAKTEQAATDINDASDILLNFNVNTTPDFTLRVLMDQTSGDKISLNGSGTIKANYFNKGNFEMYGTYLIDHGSYNLTIQNFIKKDFQFQQGSSIVFGGDPFNAQLGLKAIYQVNGVSLADLKIGNSFSSNNVRVDCIMNISGTPGNIKVDFDFDMPTVNNDAKQMVRSLINSEEEMNQQMVYLLAIGRFYMDTKNNSTQEDAQQSQTSLAMQSLLSGTISQQVNSLLSSVIKNNNWNFGTNISTGTEGFNNAEYEGLLSGSLFSNRLLINGQFGYRDNQNTTSSFIGDFDLKYLLTPSGSVAIKVYNQTNDRYFTKSSINTQGIGLILKRDFGNWREMFGIKRKKKANKNKGNEK